MPLHLQSLLGVSAWLVLFLIILNHSLLLAFSFIDCGARLGPFLHLCLWLPRCRHVNWFITFLATLQSLDSSLLHHQLTSPWPLPIARLISLSEFQTGIVAAAHATLDMEQLIPHLIVSLVGTLSSLPNSEGGVIPVSEVYELPLKVYDFLDNAVFKWAGDSAHILAHMFNSASRQHYEVWASQFPSLHSLKYVVPPSEASLYGSINWFLAQAQ